jgi:hypothetical protein
VDKRRVTKQKQTSPFFSKKRRSLKIKVGRSFSIRAFVDWSIFGLDYFHCAHCKTSQHHQQTPDLFAFKYTYLRLLNKEWAWKDLLIKIYKIFAVWGRPQMEEMKMSEFQRIYYKNFAEIDSKKLWGKKHIVSRIGPNQVIKSQKKQNYFNGFFEINNTGLIKISYIKIYLGPSLWFLLNQKGDQVDFYVKMHNFD